MDNIELRQQLDLLREAAGVEYLAAGEALGHSAPLAYRVLLPVLGVPLEVRSNSRSVIAAAERSFGGWRELPARLVAPIAPRRVDIVVQPGSGGSARGTPLYRIHGDCFLGACGDDLMTAQFSAGTALGCVTPATVADDVYFRSTFLECLAFLLICPNDRAPLHAGAVVCNDRAVLLVGRSGTGKSTLCYACVQAGFQLLAEDVVYVGLRDGLSLWGNPQRIHLLPDTAALFPELEDLEPALRANGKLKLALEIDTLAPQRRRFHALSATVCFVTRHDQLVSTLEPVGRQAAIAELCDAPEPGFDLAHELRAVAEALVAEGAYRLRLGRQPGGAVALLEQLTGN